MQSPLKPIPAISLSLTSIDDFADKEGVVHGELLIKDFQVHVLSCPRLPLRLPILRKREGGSVRSTRLHVANSLGHPFLCLVIMGDCHLHLRKAPVATSFQAFVQPAYEMQRQEALFQDS